MKTVFALLVVCGMFTTSCSKMDESVDPYREATDSVVYTLTPAHQDMNIVYDVFILSAKGMDTIRNHKGVFQKTVAAKKVGSDMVDTKLGYKTVAFKGKTFAIDCKMEIGSKYQKDIIRSQHGSCPYEERIIFEKKPISFLYIKY